MTIHDHSGRALHVTGPVAGRQHRAIALPGYDGIDLAGTDRGHRLVQPLEAVA